MVPEVVGVTNPSPLNIPPYSSVTKQIYAIVKQDGNVHVVRT